MATQLERILAHTRIEVIERRASADLPRLERTAAARRPKGFAAGLRKAAITRPAVIAELKRASPSRGLIREDFEPAAMARSLQAAGAAALSVLTDQEFFRGTLNDLKQAASAVKIPCLRKDFIVDSFQILEARAAGADAILLIVAAHRDQALKSLFLEAQAMGIEVLCEVHDRGELQRAEALGFTIIGVNSRNLHTMQVDRQTQIELAEWMPHDALKVAESGIETAADMAQLIGIGYDAFLVGEALMRHPDPGAALTMLLKNESSRSEAEVPE